MRIRVGNSDLAHASAEAWRAQIGLVDQNAFLFHASVWENIQLGKIDASDDEVRRAIVMAGADDFVRELPEGYDTVIGDRGHRLSGGQRQRLVIARALVRDPQIIIFDEGTSHLDSESERHIQAALRRLHGDRTVICVAHQLSTVQEADQILVLDRGRLVEQGTHAELLAHGGCYARLWRLQHPSTPGL
jgi:ATP-binding cassette subfamily B protein